MRKEIQFIFCCRILLPRAEPQACDELTIRVCVCVCRSFASDVLVERDLSEME